MKASTKNKAIKKLEDIAKLKFGLHTETAAEGNVKYLLAGHFNDSGQPANFSDSFLLADARNQRFLLQENDVILAGKGLRIFAWAYDVDFGACIPSSLFYLIRTDKDVILGKYLACLLNSEKMQHQLKLIGSGATITSIPKRELSELKIEIPSLKEQQKIIDAAELFDGEIELLQRILEEKQKLKRGVLNKLLKTSEI